MVVIRVRLLFIHDFRGGKEEGIGVNCERWKRWKHPFQWRFLCLLWCLSCRWPCLDWLGGDVAGGSTFLSQIFEVQTQFPHAQMQLLQSTLVSAPSSNCLSSKAHLFLGSKKFGSKAFENSVKSRPQSELESVASIKASMHKPLRIITFCWSSAVISSSGKSGDGVERMSLSSSAHFKNSRLLTMASESASQCLNVS